MKEISSFFLSVYRAFNNVKIPFYQQKHLLLNN